MSADAQSLALLRIRVIRRDSYRCRFRHDRSSECGAVASSYGARPADDEIVALCARHSSGV